MPHDVNGHELKVGDIVSVELEVADLSATVDHCNVRLVKKGVYAAGEVSQDFWLNSRQVEKAVDRDERGASKTEG